MVVSVLGKFAVELFVCPQNDTYRSPYLFSAKGKDDTSSSYGVTLGPF
jgi:hypothetical protein